MTSIKNLGYRTDAIFHLRDGFIEEHADYWSIRTPTNPSFWFGNFILFKQAPGPGDLNRWLQIHDQVFGKTLNHVTLGWDEANPGSTEEFLADGFKSSDGMVLSLSEYSGETTINPKLEVRKLTSESEWKEMTDLQIEIDRDYFKLPQDNGVFRNNQMVALKKMADEGQGDWWGAFDQGELVGGMGLYFDEDRTIGRFQYVTTRESHRRQRVCTTLLDQVVRHAFATVRPESLVINTGADDDNPALVVYKKFGFREAMLSHALTRHD